MLMLPQMMKLILSIALFVVVVAEARNLPNDDASNDHRCHHCNTRQERSAPTSSGEVEESSSKGHHSGDRKHNNTMSEGEQKPWQGTSRHSARKHSAPASSGEVEESPTKVHHSGDRHGSKSGGVPEPRHGASHTIQARSAPHCHHCSTREERSAPSTDSGSDENTSGSGQQSSESGSSKEGSSEEQH